MAPVRTTGPRTKRGPQNLANIGVEGRATGLTVDERPRDENGLEILENWYSSPAPALGDRNGMSISSETMDVAQSSGPEPSEVIASGKLTQSKRRSIVPRGRSPIKTSLGATPLRGTPKPSASVAQPRTQERTVQKSPRRLLDFSVNETSRSALRSGGSRQSDTRVNGNSHNLENANMFDIPPSPTRIRSSPVKGTLPSVGDTRLSIEIDDFQENSLPPAIGDDDIGDGLEVEQQQLTEDPEATQVQDDDIDPSLEDYERSIEPQEEQLQEDLQSPEEEQDVAEPEPLPIKRKGRPPKRPLAQRDTNQKSKPQREGRSATKQGQAQTKRPVAPRAPQRQRLQTPAEEDGVQQTRFGRNSYKPLAYWKGERAVFQEHTHNQDLREIIRIEDNTPQKRPPKSIPLRRKKRDYTVFEEHDQDYEEPWEINEGVIGAPVRLWDSELGVAPPEIEVDQQLAFASARIQPRASPDNPHFFFTKTLTMPFFGSGVIEIPAGGHKGLKNSRKFQFIFFVHYGKVKVEVAGTPFTITKGGMWQVPRGNFYSIVNATDHPAKIFFAQSCEIVVDVASAPPLENLNA